MAFYRPGGTPLKSWKSSAEALAPYRLCAVVFEAYEDLPDPELAGWLEARLKKAGRAGRYGHIREYLSNGMHEDAHKLLGYANPVQGSMEWALESPVDEAAIQAMRTQSSRPGEILLAAQRWRLLLQVVADGNANMTWGDVGMAYFWIPEEDLRAQRFDRVETIMQCH
jgi:hypothetical protein